MLLPSTTVQRRYHLRCRCNADDGNVLSLPPLAQARTLSLASIYKAGEDAAYATFCKMRWAETDGAPMCPRCGCLKAYDVKDRRKFKCAGCAHQFSVTSGTIFASRKMAFTDLCAAIVLCVNAVKGLSALQLGLDIDCQYKTAFILAHKIREALALEVEGLRLAGEVDIDGAYFGGHVRPANRKADRKDRRRIENKSDDRRVVVVLREREGQTRTFVAEREAEDVVLAAEHVEPEATVYADEAAHWDVLHGNFGAVGRIDHSEAYVTNDANTNQAESYFSRLRRMVDGQHHHVSARYLYQHAAEAAWKEDHRSLSNGDAFRHTVALAMAAPVSRQWKGFSERNMG